MGSPSVGNKPFQVYPHILMFESEMALWGGGMATLPRLL